MTTAIRAVDRDDLAGDVAARSEARNPTSAATSSGVPARFIGTSALDRVPVNACVGHGRVR